MSLQKNNEIKVSQKAKASKNTISLFFENNIEAKIKIEEKASYLSFELISLTNKDAVDLIIWGPYSTTINKII